MTCISYINRAESAGIQDARNGKAPIIPESADDEYVATAYMNAYLWGLRNMEDAHEQSA